MYQTVWEESISEVLPYIRKPGSRHDPHAVAIARGYSNYNASKIFSVHLMEILIGKNIDEWLTIRQIHQYFLPPHNCAIWYAK